MFNRFGLPVPRYLAALALLFSLASFSACDDDSTSRDAGDDVAPDLSDASDLADMSDDSAIEDVNVEVR